MKKVRIIIAISMCFSLLSTVSIKGSEPEDLYVRSEKSESYDEYVEKVFDRLLAAQSDIPNMDKIELGQGIKVLKTENSVDYYVYPVLSGNDIIRTIQVVKGEDGEFAATFTQSLAEELNSLKGQTSINTPLALIKQDALLYAEIDGNRTLLENHQGQSTEKISKRVTMDALPDVDFSGLEVINVSENTVSNNVAYFPNPLSGTKRLSWTVYETQGNNPWCASITITNIVRNNTGRSVTSSQVRKFVNSNSGLTNSQVVYFLSSGLKISNILSIASGRPSQSTIESEINNGRAIYSAFRSNTDGHAMAIIGYNTSSNIYYIHNPWYSYTETVTVGGSMALNGEAYKWVGGAIYNIHR